VTTGGVSDGQIAILSGISAGDRVVIAGQNKLYRGAPVQIDADVAL
jgi:membrane fusion protein (multidrug efflux system)